MKARGGKFLHVFMPVLVVCLLVLTCALYAATAPIQKNTQQVKPAGGTVPNHLRPDVLRQGNTSSADLDAQLREVLVPIYFEIYRTDLSADAKRCLNNIANFLKLNPTVRLLAEGNADEPGNAEYNMGIGDARARAVKTYLTGNGITADRLETTSYGKERPCNPNCGADEGCHAKNRRVEWKVLSK